MGLIGERMVLMLQRRPLLLRTALRLREQLAPGAGRGRVIADGQAVREAFERPRDFLMGVVNEPKLKAGRFLLGMDPGPQYDREKKLMAEALSVGARRFEELAKSESDRAAAELAALLERRGRIDLAAPFAERVYARVLGSYMGVRPEEARSERLPVHPGVDTLAAWIRTLGATIGSSHPAPFGLEELAEQAAVEFREYLGREVEHARAAAHGAPASVIGHLLAAGQQSDDIVRMVAGMMSAGAGFAKAFTHATDELLRRGKLAEVARSVARDEPTIVQDYVREALRFRPVFPLLARYCPRATQLQEGSGRPLAVEQGADLALFPLAAMFDPAQVERPEEFIPGRPAQTYMLFGAGPRACLGEPLMMALFFPLFRALFAHVPSVLGARPGTFRYDSAAVDRYELRPEPGRVSRREFERPAESQPPASHGEPRSLPLAAAPAPARCPMHHAQAAPHAARAPVPDDAPVEPRR